MGCTSSSMLMSGQRCCKVDHDVVVLKLGTVVVNDSIHMMIERDLRRKARSTNTAAAAENSEYRFRAPHPLLSSSSSSRQATLVTTTTRLLFSKTTSCPRTTRSRRTIKMTHVVARPWCRCLLHHPFYFIVVADHILCRALFHCLFCTCQLGNRRD
jgi:hypothetical protein